MVVSAARVQKIVDKFFRKRLQSFAGRNHLGRICVFHRGAGDLRLYRPVDFYRRLNLFGHILRLSSHTFRTTFVALILYSNGLLSSILSVEGLQLGSTIFSGFCLPDDSAKVFQKGSALPLQHIHLFSLVSAVASVPGQAAKFFRSAGVSSLFVAREQNVATLKCSSG